MLHIFLAVLSIAALYSVTHQNPRLRKAAPIFGVTAQPFWLYAAWTSQEWGILVVTCVYAAIWIKDLVYTWFLKPLEF